MKDLQSFRTWGSLTPGHPEYGHTAGVEMTTGPLGQGVATAVGMAMAARYERGLLDPTAPANTSIFDHSIWVICSDGDLQEGVSAEASSLAGTQELGNLNIIYDDNRISIEGDTHNAFTEDVAARYRAYGWHVIEVAALATGNIDLVSLDAAMVAAKKETSKPTLIRMHSVIAWPAPKAQGTAGSHGSALGVDEIKATKIALGLNPDEDFRKTMNMIGKAIIINPNIEIDIAFFKPIPKTPILYKKAPKDTIEAMSQPEIDPLDDNLDPVAFAKFTDRTTRKRFGTDMADACPCAYSRESSIGKNRYVLAIL
jgi:transketolase